MTNEYQHPAFPPRPDPDVVLWRYLDFEKFDCLLSTGRLIMPSAQFLGDPLEGTSPPGHEKWWKDLEANAESEDHRRIITDNHEKLSGIAEVFRQHYYYVSCWHMNAVENSKMWGAYTKSSDAVAVTTSYRALRSALPTYIEIGMVRYLDYANERLPSMNMFEYITHKNTNFCFEREVRAVAFRPAVDGLGLGDFQKNLFELESKKGFVVLAPEVGVANLIHSVILHPDATEKFAQQIESRCQSQGLPVPQRSVFSNLAEV
jgi:hypothetical protein